MPAAHFLGLRPRLVFAQYPDDLLLAEATHFHRPSPFSGDGLYLISAEFSGCRPGLLFDFAKNWRRPAKRRTRQLRHRRSIVVRFLSSTAMTKGRANPSRVSSSVSDMNRSSFTNAQTKVGRLSRSSGRKRRTLDSLWS